MMGRVTISSNCGEDSTYVSNIFIDEYMQDANDAQIKIYLFLLRMMSANLPTSVEALADCCVAFCERVKDSGYTPMVYQNTGTAMHKLDLPRIKDYDFWLAEYADKPSYYYDFKIWQYSNTGHIPGIEGDVDLNICFRPY